MFGEMRNAMPQQLRRGMTPQESYWLEKIDKEIATSKKRKGTGFTGFVSQMKQICELGSQRKLNSPCCYIYKNKAVAQIELTNWQHTNGRRVSVLYLTKLYVLDIERDSGVGTEFLKKIKEIVDDTGMAIFFFATSFSLSNEDHGLPFAFADMDQMLKCWEAEHLTFTEDGDEVLQEWYSRQGFYNGCIHDNQEWESKEWHKLTKQFMYVGENCYDYDLLMNRTNPQHFCSHCKQQLNQQESDSGK